MTANRTCGAAGRLATQRMATAGAMGKPGTGTATGGDRGAAGAAATRPWVVAARDSAAAPVCGTLPTAAGGTVHEAVSALPLRRATADRIGLRRAPAMAAMLSALSLAACAPGGGMTNPMAGMTNPLAGFKLPVIGAPPAAAPGAGAGGTAIVDPFAGQGVAPPDIPAGDPVKPAPAAPAADGASQGAGTTTGAAPRTRPGTAATTPATAAATTHKVAAGETAWSISRKYGVPIAALAQANGLPETMTVRTGQTLTIPAGGTGAATGTGALTAPGAGSPTPEPPSASKPLPREQTAAAGAPVAKPSGPDLGATRTAASGGGGRFSMPVAGSITRTYAKGRNDGIDISAPAGTAVKAAGSGTVAAITRDTAGTPIVVVRHEGSLMTVYAGLGGLKVAKGDKVKAGEAIGTSGNAGTLHFEVRDGFESVDPERYLR